MTTVEMTELGKYGVIQDMPDHILPPEAFTNGRNIRFSKRGVRRMEGHEQVFGTLSIVPEFITNVGTEQGSFWIYTSLTKAYVVEAGVHTNITRQVAMADVDYTATEGRQWNSTFIGGVPILNNGIDIPQWWSDLNPSQNLDDMTDWPSTLRAKVLRGFGGHLVALNITDNGVLQPHKIRWSHKADPGTLPSSWDVSDPTVDAGQIDLTDIEGGEIVDGYLLGQYLIIYKAGATHAMRFSGNNEIFAFDLLLSTSGILAARTATPFKKGTQHFVVTEDDVIIHAGAKEASSVFEDRDKNFLFRDMDATNYVNTHVFDNVKQKECWICYPSNGSEYPDMAAIWDYKNDTVTFRELPGLVSVDSGPVSESVGGTWDAETGAWDSQTAPWAITSRNDLVGISRSTTGAARYDSGYAFGATTPTAFIERTGLSIDGQDKNRRPISSLASRKLLTRLWPKISGAAQVTIRAGSQQLLNGTITWADPQVFDPATMKYLDFTVEGLLLAWRIEWAADVALEIQGVDFEIVKIAGL
jgi:hypothetical protein